MSDVLFKKDGPEQFHTYWAELVNQCNGGPRASLLGLKYAFTLAAERGLKDDKSFVLLQSGKVKGGALVPIGIVDDHVAITMGGEYVLAPMAQKETTREEAFEIIDDIANDVGAVKSMIDVDPMLGEPCNYLTDFGYLDTSHSTYVYDLTRPGDLKTQLEKNHRRSLKKIMDDTRFLVIRIDRDAPSREHHENHERLHEKCSGKKTRSSRTFDVHYEQLLAGEAVLFCVLFDKKPAMYGYFQHVNGRAHYISTSDDPEITGYPMQHLLTYTAMEYYRGIGIRAIVPGGPSCLSPQLDYYPDEKALDIAYFKSRFVGSFLPYFRGIRYYSSTAAAADSEKFKREYQRSLQNYENWRSRNGLRNR